MVDIQFATEEKKKIETGQKYDVHICYAGQP